MQLNKLRLLFVPAIAALLPALATASTGPVIGSFGFAGPGVLVFQAGADFIRFCTYTDSSCAAAATAQGDLKVSGPGTQSFSVLSNLDFGKIDSTTDVTPPAAPYAYLPVAMAVSIDHWLTINSQPNWNFQANLLALANCPAPSASQQCVGPFQLDTSGANNVSVFIVVSGTIINTTDGSRSSFSATLTGQYVGTTIDAVIANAQTPAGILSNSWSGSITATPIVSGGCPATPGFWKNQNKHPFPTALTFPVSIGGISYSANDFYTILNNPGGGNAVQILGFQLVASILNVAAGGKIDTSAMAAITQANIDLAGISLLTGSVSPSSTLGKDMLAQATVLSGYNTGFFGTCTDGTGLTLGK